MSKGAMEYFSDLERGMKAKEISYAANMWEYALPKGAAAEVTRRLDGGIFLIGTPQW